MSIGLSSTSRVETCQSILALFVMNGASLMKAFLRFAKLAGNTILPIDRALNGCGVTLRKWTIATSYPKACSFLLRKLRNGECESSTAGFNVAGAPNKARYSHVRAIGRVDHDATPTSNTRRTPAPEIISQRSLGIDSNGEPRSLSPPSSQSTEGSHTSLSEPTIGTDSSEERDYEIVDIDFSDLPLPPHPDMMKESYFCE